VFSELKGEDGAAVSQHKILTTHTV
jgi:hypothetical protein